MVGYIGVRTTNRQPILYENDKESELCREKKLLQSRKKNNKKTNNNAKMLIIIIKKEKRKYTWNSVPDFNIIPIKTTTKKNRK